MSAAFRRVGAHRVIDKDQVLRQAVVEISHGHVVSYYPFVDELPVTEWLGGTIQLCRDTRGALRAYWFEGPMSLDNNGKLLE